MKKFFIVALAAMSMTFVSCGKKSVEDQAKAYAEQMIQMEGAVKVMEEPSLEGSVVELRL